MLEYYNRLPHYVKINNEKFIINADYRIFINFEMEMQGNDKKKAIYNALNSFYPAFSHIYKKGYFNEAVEEFIKFYQMNNVDSYKQGRTTKNAKKISQIYNYQYDAKLICGAYKIYAGVDLHKYLHWWTFKEIWDNLPSECEFVKVKSYRAYSGDDKNILELKEFYKLPLTEYELQDKIRRDKIYEALK